MRGWRSEPKVRQWLQRELREETGLAVCPEQLHSLHPHPLHTSIGLLNEAIYFYGAQIELPHRAFSALRGRLRGEVEEHERITTGPHTADELSRTALCGQVLLGLHLFGKWRRHAGRKALARDATAASRRRRTPRRVEPGKRRRLRAGPKAVQSPRE